MPELDCSVVSCTYNKDKLCAKGDIMVDGRKAKEPSSTCCSSFEERKGDRYHDSNPTACHCIDVDCKAENCTFNDDCKCHANHIGISGSHACCCEETECASFCCR